MRYKLLGCKIFEREIAAVTYNCKNIIDVTLVRQKLHDRPQKLSKALQEEIDLIDAGTQRFTNDASARPFDAILLGYGLCSGTVEGLSSKYYPLVIPRVHDCIALLMGDRDKYDRFYKENGDTFFYSPGYVEWCDIIRLEDQWEQRYQWHLQRHHGNEKLAHKLLEKEKSLTSHYGSLTYIRWPELDFPEYRKRVSTVADKKGWRYQEVDGSKNLLKGLVDGEWDEKNFIVIPAGCSAEQSYDERVLQVKE